MANYQLVADVSGWHPDNQSFFNLLAKAGCTAVIVKLTEGTGYTNPKAYNQIRCAWKAGMHAHGYHFARFQNATQAVAEAIYFTNAAKKLGLDASSAMAVDVEADTLPKTGLTTLSNTFMTRVIAQGYPKVDFYTMASWMTSGRISQKALLAKNLWIARWGASMPGVDNVGTWQYTNNFQGLNVDMSYDFKGFYSKV